MVVVVVCCCFYVLLVGRVSCYSSLPRYLMFVMLLCYYVMVVLVSDVRWVCIVVSCVMCHVSCVMCRVFVCVMGAWPSTPFLPHVSSRLLTVGCVSLVTG